MDPEMLIDTHCHIDDAAFAKDREDVLRAARNSGVSQIVVPAVTRQSWKIIRSISLQHPGLHCAWGLHPMFIAQHRQEDLEALQDWLQDNPAIAIGEIGLDYYIKDYDAETQRYYFVAQLDIAQQMGLPVILHVRKAHDPVLQILRKFSLPGGIAHAFNGSLQQAQQYLDLGFKLGFGGTLTYENAHKIHRLARELPEEAFVLETDAPDMVVSQHRGERNSPEYLPYCLRALAEVRQTEEKHLASVTSNNANAVLNLR